MPFDNIQYEEDDYEVVLAEEVDDNLLFSNRINDLQGNNELDEATMSYNEESGNYTASLQERSDKKQRKENLLPKEIYTKKNEPSNQKQSTFKPTYDRPSKVKSLAIPDSFDIDTSIYNARNTQGQNPPPNDFQSNTSNFSTKNSQNAKNLNNLILGGHSSSMSSVKNHYAKTFHSNVYTNI